MFSHLAHEKPHKCVLKPSEQCSFPKMIDLRGHMPRFESNDFLSICLQGNNFVHIWCQMHFKVMIFLAFAFQVMILYIFGAKCM